MGKEVQYVCVMGGDGGRKYSMYVQWVVMGEGGTVCMCNGWGWGKEVQYVCAMGGDGGRAEIII